MAWLIEELEVYDGTIPPKDDGTVWQYIMMGGPKIMYADTTLELMSAFAPNYLETGGDDNEGAFEIREELALVFAESMRTTQLKEYLEANPGGITEDELQVMTASSDEVLEIAGTWDHTMRLMLVATDYEPYTDVSAPEGNVAFINPITEESFLQSLHRAGFLQFGINTKEEDDVMIFSEEGLDLEGAE